MHPPVEVQNERLIEGGPITVKYKGRHKRESKKQETRNKKQNGLAHLQFLFCVTPKKKNIA